MAIQLRAGHTTRDLRLDRIPQHDPANANYPIRALFTDPDTKPLRSYTWACNQWLDQGRQGACVAFGINHERAARPVAVTGITEDTTRDLYHDIQRDDPWPGGEYPGADPQYAGTSVLSGMQAAVRRGYYGQYRWAQNERDVALAVGYHGPVIIGVNWYEGMVDVDTAGYIRPTGQPLGGHCTLLHAFNRRGGYYVAHNSWGRTWGYNGRAKISRDDLARLLAENGEAVIPLARKTTA